MRILVIGASGLVGSHVAREAVSRGHDVLGTHRNCPTGATVALDLADESATRALFESYKPDWVVHAAGWTWVDGCERDPARAYKENADQPAMLARLCQAYGTRMAYFSTTYVFDGKNGPYDELSQPTPVNVYAQTKLAGEANVLSILGANALIPRVICVWGREVQQKNFVYQVIKAVQEGRSLRLPSDQEGNPTWAGDIAAWLLDLIGAHESGVWNLVGDNPRCTRIDWLNAILEGIINARSDLAGAVRQWTYERILTSELGQPALRPLRAGGLADKIQARFPRQTLAAERVEIIIKQ